MWACGPRFARVAADQFGVQSCNRREDSWRLHAAAKLGKTFSMTDTKTYSARLRRSILSVPAINLRALEKARGLDCDGVIFDLEDSVAPEMKAQARENLSAFFAAGRLEGREIVIRINALSSAFGADDMACVIALQPDAVLIPKVDEPYDVLAV